MKQRHVIVGGGAAGFFAAIASAQANSTNEVQIFERGSNFLAKVRISGGGRCNVTHAWSEAQAFTGRYPRGARELMAALHRFDANDTVSWFENRDVALKTEADGRMFPTTDTSATIVDCLLREAARAGVQLFPRRSVERIDRTDDGGFVLTDQHGDTIICDRVLLSTGGARNESGAQLARALGHEIEPPVPSLFTFQIDAPSLRALAGVSVVDVEATVADTALRERGPLLITHAGVSGPVVLRLSAWGARDLHEREYEFVLRVNWLPAENNASIAERFRGLRAEHPKRRVANSPIAPLPARLWEELVAAAGVSPETIWTNLSRVHAQNLSAQLLRTELPVHGKSMNKDEFVTCGGVRLREINFKTMESRLTPGLYFAGEFLDLDGITGGFNFQAAWTTGWIAGRAMAGAEASPQ